MLKNTELLQTLTSIPGASGDEGKVKDFIVRYVETHKNEWNTIPTLFHGGEFQDALILVFGQPKTAIFAHTDTIGFTVGYQNNLIKIGGPRLIDGIQLVGEDSQGKIETELMIIENENGEVQTKCVFDRIIDRGTNLTFKPEFNLSEDFIQSPYLDNRLGVYVALQVAETIENGAIVFSTYEEHGGGSVGFLGRFLFDKYNLRQALISDITWVTDGVKHGNGVAVSMRDQGIPRKSYLNKIINLARDAKIKFQLEVESAGGSDGTMLQKSDLPFDWCFIGAPEDNVHTPNEKVHIDDINEMIKLYRHLITFL